jgi:hypothetical protein
MTAAIFVSSTFADLERHRTLVLETISRLEHESKAMESFGALPETPKEECLRLVRSANAYVGIFGMRYGTIDPSSGKSLTQLEYEEARSLRLPSLIYIIDEDTHPVLPRHVETGASAEKLVELKATLKESHVVQFFSSAEDLASKVAQDVARLMGAMSKTPTAQVLSQIATNAVRRHPLTPPRFEFLRGKVAHLFSHAIPESVLREALELTIAGDNMAAAFVLSRGTPMPLDDAVDGLMGVGKILVEIVENNKASAAEKSDV